MIELKQIRHAYPEKKMYIDRKDGHPDYTFLHFYNSVRIWYEGKMIVTEPHAVILYRPGTMQHYESDTPIVHDWMHFHGDVEPLLDTVGWKPDLLYYPSSAGFITDLVKELEIESYNRYPKSDRLIELKLEELLIKIERAILGKKEEEFDVAVSEKIRYLRGKMFAGLQEPWPVKRMAEEVGFSVSRFYAIYKAIYGIPPAADLIEARMNSAKNMLLFGNKRVEEIAALNGYENQTHFIRQFKEQTGCTPAVYRKNHREQRREQSNDFISK